MDKKKLLYISSTVVPSNAADSVHVMKMCQAFSSFYNVELICYTGIENIDVDKIFEDYGVKSKFSIQFQYLKIFRAKFFQKFWSIFNFLRKYPKDSIIYGRDVYGLYLAALMGFEVYYESHGIPVSKLYGKIEQRLFKHKNFKKLIVISGKLKDLYEENDKYQIQKDKILVFHDGADILEPARGESLGSGFHIGYIGSLFYNGRGIDIIVEAAKLNPAFTFHLIGGTEEQIAFWKDRSTENVKFYGYLPHSEASKFLPLFDVVLMPYQKTLKLETMNVDTSAWMSPMKMFEYMAAGKAIVSSNLPVIMEVLNDSNSVLLEPDDVQAWSDALNYLHDNEGFRNSIAQKAYSDFLENYTWLKRAERLSEEFG